MDEEFQVEGLDVTLCCVGEEWPQDVGGYVHYQEDSPPEPPTLEGADADMVVPLLPEEEDPDLITLDPRPNTLCLVLREPNVQRFVKFVSSAAPEDRFDFSALYTLQPNDDDDAAVDLTGKELHGDDESEETDDDDLGETMVKALEARGPATKKQRTT